MPAVFFQRKRAAEARPFSNPAGRASHPGSFGAEDTKQHFPTTGQLWERKPVLDFYGEKGRKCVEQKPAKWGICTKNGTKKARQGMTSLDEKII
jgi:hypothetical protein